MSEGAARLLVTERPATSYDDVSCDALAHVLGVPGLRLFDEVGSTQDIAHRLGASGAPAGTLVLTDAQSSGRGRQGKSWHSAPGAGIWLTLLERPRDVAAVEVLSLRLGLRAAAVLDAFATVPVQLKWPNDLYLGRRKLAGILVEARWRDARLDWVAIGFGLNVSAPADVATAVGLAPGTERVRVLAELVPALRSAALATGPLTTPELTAFARRDLARGRRCISPLAGVVLGIDGNGALRVRTDSGDAIARAGSLVFEENAC